MLCLKIALVACVLAVTRCEPPNNQYGTPLGAPISSYGTPNYNADGHNHEYNEPKAYEFGYQVKDDYTGNNYNRQEASDGNQVRGEYRVALPDGRTQIVTYYADWQTGYHADVRYEGTAHYPDQYNNAPANQYGAPGGYQGGDYAAPATSSVSIKDYASGNGGNYDGYSSGGFASKIGPTPVYGAP